MDEDGNEVGNDGDGFEDGRQQGRWEIESAERNRKARIIAERSDAHIAASLDAIAGLVALRGPVDISDRALMVFIRRIVLSAAREVE